MHGGVLLLSPNAKKIPPPLEISFLMCYTILNAMTERVGDAFKADREKGSWWKPFDFLFR